MAKCLNIVRFQQKSSSRSVGVALNKHPNHQPVEFVHFQLLSLSIFRRRRVEPPYRITYIMNLEIDYLQESNGVSPAVGQLRFPLLSTHIWLRHVLVHPMRPLAVC